MKGLIDIQKHIVEETLRLDKLRGAEGELTRGQAQSVLDVGHQEQSLATDCEQLAAKLVGAESFQFELHSAAGDMTHAAARLLDRDTGAETQQLEQDVLQRLQDLIEAMKQGAPPGEPASRQQKRPERRRWKIGQEYPLAGRSASDPLDARRPQPPHASP